MTEGMRFAPNQTCWNLICGFERESGPGIAVGIVIAQLAAPHLNGGCHRSDVG